MDKYNTIDFSFIKAAIYKIVVQGEIDQKMSDRMMGLQASVHNRKDKGSITTLIGQINDQSALSGILTMINDMHMTVISVNMLSELESA